MENHLFILGLPAVRINGVPFSLVLSGKRVTNHVLVFSIRAFSKLRGVFLCEAFFRIIRRKGVLMSLFCILSIFVLYVEPTCCSGSVIKVLCAANDAVLYLEYCTIVRSVMSRRGRGLPGKYHRLKRS